MPILPKLEASVLRTLSCIELGLSAAQDQSDMLLQSLLQTQVPSFLVLTHSGFCIFPSGNLILPLEINKNATSIGPPGPELHLCATTHPATTGLVREIAGPL